MDFIKYMSYNCCYQNSINLFISLGLQYANNADVASNRILNDESLSGNTNAEILEFKTKLKEFVEKYESSRNFCMVWNIIAMYTDAVDKYFHIPEDKITPENNYILELLKKHKGSDVATRFLAEFKKFENNFVSLFEENKEHLEKPMLDWYEKFKTFNNTEKKIDAFSEFFELFKKEMVEKSTYHLPRGMLPCVLSCQGKEVLPRPVSLAGLFRTLLPMI
ncbi:hypothetical protein FF38_12695 [Lucilia cuprina]|uniref:Uncharacterized protein n=1 Tax=Lucilia cuprina TaxID=7375 RepID=A0A0L0C6P1_LUCCU|nr:hypothetical protein FF38_12695 [Lucilia cuprina]